MATSALELRHLETLLALAECGNLSKAADRLCLTQSALSHQLKVLESHYGASLVEKNVRPLRFTAIGRRLVRLAREVLPQVADAGRDVARLAQGHAERGEAELAIIHDKPKTRAAVVFSPLFRYESVALMSPRYPLVVKHWLEPADFAGETLITHRQERPGMRAVRGHRPQRRRSRLHPRIRRADPRAKSH
jgi:LysR family transcriptional regulator, regulator for metE and metH